MNSLGISLTDISYGCDVYGLQIFELGSVVILFGVITCNLLHANLGYIISPIQEFLADVGLQGALGILKLVDVLLSKSSARPFT